MGYDMVSWIIAPIFAFIVILLIISLIYLLRKNKYTSFLFLGDDKLLRA